MLSNPPSIHHLAGAISEPTWEPSLDNVKIPALRIMSQWLPHFSCNLQLVLNSKARDKGIHRLHISDEDADINDDDDTIEIAEDD